MMRWIAGALWILCNLMVLAAGQDLLPGLAWEKATVFLLALSFSATLIHELGHAIAARRLGTYLQIISVWGFGYDFVDRRWGAQRHAYGAEVGGFVKFAFFKGTAHQNQKIAIIAICGPAANLLCALLVVMLDLTGIDLINHGVAMIFATLSCGMGIVNLIPFGASDGRKIIAYVQSLRTSRSQ